VTIKLTTPNRMKMR